MFVKPEGLLDAREKMPLIKPKSAVLILSVLGTADGEEFLARNVANCLLRLVLPRQSVLGVDTQRNKLEVREATVESAVAHLASGVFLDFKRAQ